MIFHHHIRCFRRQKEARFLFWTPWLGKVQHTGFRSFAKRKSASTRGGGSICLSGDKRCAVGRDAWLAGLCSSYTLLKARKFEWNPYWLESYHLLYFWGKFGGGIAAGLHFCYCFPLIVSYKAAVERSIATASYGW